MVAPPRRVSDALAFGPNSQVRCNRQETYRVVRCFTLRVHFKLRRARDLNANCFRLGSQPIVISVFLLADQVFTVLTQHRQLPQHRDK